MENLISGIVLISGVWIPIIIGFGVPVAVFTMIVMIRRYEKEERLKMIEAGMNPDEYKAAIKGNKYQGASALKWGTLLVGAGIGLLLAYLLAPYVGQGNHDEDVPLYFGLIGIFGGIGLVIGHMLARKQGKEDDAE